MSMLVWLTCLFCDFAVFDPSPLTVCINCSFLHLYLLFYYYLSRLLIMSINTTFPTFQDGGRPPSSIFKSSKFQLLVWFGGPMCVIMPNAVQIGQTVIFKLLGCRPPASWISLDLCNGPNSHEGRTASPCQISWRSVRPLSRYLDFWIFQDGGRRHIEFS